MLAAHTVAMAQLTGVLLLSSLDPDHQLCVAMDEAVLSRLQTERDQIVVYKYMNRRIYFQSVTVRKLF